MIKGSVLNYFPVEINPVAKQTHSLTGTLRALKISLVFSTLVKILFLLDWLPVDGRHWIYLYDAASNFIAAI